MKDMIWNLFSSNNGQDVLAYQDKNAQGKRKKIFSCFRNFGSNFHDIKNMIIFDLVAVFVDLIWPPIYEQTFPDLRTCETASKITLNFFKKSQREGVTCSVRSNHSASDLSTPSHS